MTPETIETARLRAEIDAWKTSCDRLRAERERAQRWSEEMTMERHHHKWLAETYQHALSSLVRQLEAHRGQEWSTGPMEALKQARHALAVAEVDNG